MASIGRRDAAPRVAAQAQGFAQVAGAPVERHGPAPQAGQALEVPAGPGQEGVAAAVAPDFDAGGRMAACAAGVEAGGVGDHQGVFLDGEGPRLGVAHTAQRGARDAQRAACAHAVERAGVDGLAAQPGEPAAVDAVRAGHVDERPLFRAHVVQEQPGFHGGMEGVGMQLQLRVRRRRARVRQDGLQVVHGMAAERPGIAEQPQPLFALQQLARGRHVFERAGVQRHAAGDGVALLHFAHLAGGAGQFPFDGGQGGRGQEIGLEDEAVAVEVAAVLFVQQVGQAFTATVGQPLRQPHAGDVQAGAVQPAAAEDGIVFEGFGFGRQRQHPHRRAEPAQPVRGGWEGGRRWRLGRFLWHVA